MIFKLVITNTTKKRQKVKLLYAINLNHKEKKFGLPEGVTLEMKHKTVTYEQILQQLLLMHIIIKFKNSSNNRQLEFYQMDGFGRYYPYEPQRTIDGKRRKRYKGEMFKLGKARIYEGDLFVNLFTDHWNPEKWNIADTHEKYVWTFSSFVQLYLKPNEVFEVNFILISNG